MCKTNIKAEIGIHEKMISSLMEERISTECRDRKSEINREIKSLTKARKSLYNRLNE